MMAKMSTVAALMIKTNVTIMILHTNACDNYDRHHWQKAGLIPGVALSLSVSTPLNALRTIVQHSVEFRLLVGFCILYVAFSILYYVFCIF